MELTVHFIHAFTDSVFKGNAAAVIITEKALTCEMMQKIATENKLSETAFIVQTEQDVFHIRWFSPLSEIDFCGHATLASAYVLFNSCRMSKKTSQLTFYAKAVGYITVQYLENNMIEMCFPNYKPIHVNNVPQALYEGLSIKPINVLKNQQAYFAIYEDAADVHHVKANSHIIKRLAPYDVVVSAPSNNVNYDFISRYFWPANGGDEDPVTGSAHAGLVPYWAEQLNKKSLNAYQASSRGGHLECRLADDNVFVSGSAVPYLKGAIYI